jgi:diguanylate cyclase (GGDEF)-like protein
LLDDRLRQALRVGQREASRLSVLLVDLDGFKRVNDTFGDRTGDEVLRLIGPRIKRVLRESDTVARYGGDEFVVLLPHVDSDGAQMVARKILGSLRRPFRVTQSPIYLWASVGIAVWPDHAQDPTTLLEQADGAMYMSKRREGGYTVSGGAHVFLPALHPVLG